MAWLDFHGGSRSGQKTGGQGFVDAASFTSKVCGSRIRFDDVIAENARFTLNLAT